MMSKRKTLYIHIGTGKTGTTAIQKTCETNVKILQDKYHTDCIISQSNFCKNWNNASRENLLHIESVNNNLEDLKVRIKNSSFKNFLISSEYFPGESLEEIDHLKKMLSGVCDVKIIVYFRRQDEFLWSWYAQVVKSTCIDKPLDAMIYQLYVVGDILNYKFCTENWKKVFGQENICVNVYPPSESIIKNFFRNLNIDLNLDDIKQIPAQNSSLMAEQIVLIQKLLPYIDEGDTELIEEIQQPFDIDFDYTKSLLSPEERKKILKDFEKSNNEVAKLYLNRDKLFEDLTIEDEDTWSYPDIVSNGYFDKVFAKIKNERLEESFLKMKLGKPA